MDRERFDALARLFATTGSRRAAIGALLGAGILGTGWDAEARKGKGKNKNRGKDRGRGKGNKRKGKVRAQQVPGRCCSTHPCNPGPGTNLGKCCFEDANLAGQNFKGANAGSANFSGATLTNANFTGANLGKACLVDADLTGATINASTNTGGAIFCRTTMPDGNENNSGCARGTRCCPTCDVDNPCPDGEFCCDGRCRPGDCCTTADCSEPTETCCGGTCTDTDADPDHCGECGRDCETGEVCSNGFTCQGEACLPVTSIGGDATLDEEGGLTLTTEGDDPIQFSVMRFSVPPGTTFGQIATMEADFDFATGSCGAGTPRFCVILDGVPECPCAQFPVSSGCNVAGASGSSGNLIGNNTPGDWFNICISSPPPISTYADALTMYGTETIDRIFLVVDESHGEQTVTVDACIMLAQIG